MRRPALALAAFVLTATAATAACLEPPCDYTGEWQPGDPFDSDYLPDNPYEPVSEPRYDDATSTWTYPDGTVIFVGELPPPMIDDQLVMPVIVDDGESDETSHPDGALMPDGAIFD